MNWANIRVFNGSQEKAFEKLCCQLAGAECPKPGAEFTRVGDPDAGVECYWTLPNGNEWGWQAKYFTNSPTDGQWNQIDRSVKTALEKRQKLVKYFVCLPIDRPDACIKGQKSMMDKWNDHVEKWEGWASEKGMSVKFEYWGDHELSTRLTQDEHRGRVFFFFYQEYFTTDWLKSRLDEAISDAGQRYLPLLNVDLPIADTFDGLGRTENFTIRLSKQLAEFNDAFRIARYEKFHDALKDPTDELFNAQQAIGDSVINLIHLSRGPHPLPFDEIVQLGNKAEEAADSCLEILRNLEDQERNKPQEGEAPNKEPYRLDKYRSQRSAIYRASGAIRELIKFLESSEAYSANSGALLITGDAGQGKTHLLCDNAKKMHESGHPTLLLHGNHFHSGNPWDQMLTTLQIRGERDEFLGALDALGEAKGHRVLIMIDALNESADKNMWRNHLSGMLTALRRYPWVGLAISLRSTFRHIVIPDGIDQEVLTEVVHTGFSEVPHEAINKYFDHYGLNAPRIPIILPDFTNPLFLYTFCEAIKNSGDTEIPPGVKGIYQLLKYYLASVDKIIAPILGYDEREKLVWKAALKLAEKVAERDSPWIDLDTAKSAINSLLPGKHYPKSLYFHLVDQGVIIEDAYQRDAQTVEYIVRFTYERFSDHLVAQHLLDTYLDEEHPEVAFAPSHILGSRFSDEARSSWKGGVIEALSIQLPERVEQEFFQVAPHARAFSTTRSAFIESLIWRDPARLEVETALDYINSEVTKYRGSHHEFLNALLAISSNPDHPFNADLLHRHLSKFEMAKRDSWWTIFLQESYYEGYPIQRIIEWALSPADKSRISDKIIRLLAITLCWFLTSTNRAMRDRSTKALVNLLTPRIAVLREVVKTLRDVNDPYVTERVYAVAYGCALRSDDNENIRGLAQDVYNDVFKKGNPPPHILLRDYARGVIEVALHRGLELRLSKRKIRPPYSSEWPKDIPSDGDLEQHVDVQKDSPPMEKGVKRIYSSLVYGDFGKYVIGSRLPWSRIPLTETWVPSLGEKYEEFRSSLTKRQRELWDEYQRLKFSGIRIRFPIDEARSVSDAPSDEEIIEAERRFRNSLRTRKDKIYEEVVIPFENSGYARDDREMEVSLVTRYIFQRVINLGYANDLFGEFDTGYFTYRGAGFRIERIGKKYQWIGYHEALARLSDNFHKMPDYNDNGPRKYDGPWEFDIRDLDPSHTLVSTSPNLYGKGHETGWLAPVEYPWDQIQDCQNWRLNTDDFPNTCPLIIVTRPEDNVDYYVLEANFEWVEDQLPHEADLTKHGRRLWYQLRSYLIRKDDSDHFFKWAKDKNFYGRWMLESSDLRQVYLCEYPWAASYMAQNTPYYGRVGWTDKARHNECLPSKVRVTVENYINAGNDYDNSIGDGVASYIPVPEIIEGMGLNWDHKNHHWRDSSGICIAFDPSLEGHNYRGLLIRRDLFNQYLLKNGYSLIWTVIGEKQELGETGVPLDKWVEYSEVYRLKDENLQGSRNFYEQPNSNE